VSDPPTAALLTRGNAAAFADNFAEEVGSLNPGLVAAGFTFSLGVSSLLGAACPFWGFVAGAFVFAGTTGTAFRGTLAVGPAGLADTAGFSTVDRTCCQTSYVYGQT